MKKVIICLMMFFLVGCGSSSEDNTEEVKEETETKTEEKESVNTDLTISFAGDVSLGNYAGQSNSGSFDQIYINQNKDSSYFLKNVKEVFASDDLTVVNLEGPLTTATSHADKQFAFKGLPEYSNILTSGDVQAVSVANNHSEDYFKVGFDETKSTLKSANIGYFGYEDNYTTEVKGIKLGFLGYRSMSLSMNSEEGQKTISEAINKLKKTEKCDMVFVYYHWGQEAVYQANEDQRQLAHFTIDAGADAVIGSHPHVVQGTETYNNKPIVYSLGNFCFSGNLNPRDYDSMIYQLKYSFTDNKQTSYSVNIIPCSISSSSSRNNFQPTILTGEEGQRVLDKIAKYSY